MAHRRAQGGLGIKEMTRVQGGGRGAEQSLQCIGVFGTGTATTDELAGNNEP